MRGAEQTLVCSAVLILGITASAVSFILSGAKYQLDLSIYYHQKHVRRSLVPLHRPSRFRHRSMMMPVSSFLPSDEPPSNPNVPSDNDVEPKSDDTTPPTVPNEDEYNNGGTMAQPPKITITLMVAMSSAILACLVLLCILAMRTCGTDKTDPSIFSQTIETQKLTLALPQFPRVMPTDESILDLTLYGNDNDNPIESISPMSSAVAEEDDGSSLNDREVPVEQILRRHEAPKGTADTKLVCATTESCSDSSHRQESRGDCDDANHDDIEKGTAEDDFVYDIILSSNTVISDFGLVLQDPFCAVTHPVVIRVDPESPFAGRIGPGDFLLAMDDVSLMGQSVVDWPVERRPTKFTVMTARQEGREQCSRIGTGSPVVTVEV